MILVPGVRRASALTRIPRPNSACAIVLALLCLSLAVGCADRRSRAPIDEAGLPVRGGTLELVGKSDVRSLSTTSNYWSYTWALFRTFTRQLLAYPPAAETSNYGGYISAVVNALIDQATTAPSREQAELSWREAARQLIDDAALVPLIESKNAYAKSFRVRHCVWSVFGGNCDINALWLDQR
jgi:hypothetical protein